MLNGMHMRMYVLVHVSHMDTLSIQTERKISSSVFTPLSLTTSRPSIPTSSRERKSKPRLSYVVMCCGATLADFRARKITFIESNLPGKACLDKHSVGDIT